MAEASRGVKIVQGLAIKKYRDTCSGYAAHNELYHLIRKVKGSKDFVNEVPLKPIICFLKVHLNCHKSHPSFLAWDNEREKATGPVFVLWIHAEGNKYNQQTFMKKQKTIFCGHQKALVFMHPMG